MNNQANIETEWGDGIYSFRLTMKGIIELEQKCNAPIATIICRISENEFYASDIRETIRLGLIGGGMEPAHAVRLVTRYVDNLDEFPLATNLTHARMILLAAFIGFQTSPLARAPETGTETDDGAQDPSMQQPSSTNADVWGLDQTFWDGFRSGNGLHS